MTFGELNVRLGFSETKKETAALTSGLGTAFETQILAPFFGGQAFEIKIPEPETLVAPPDGATDGERIINGTAPFLVLSKSAAAGAPPPVLGPSVDVTARFRLNSGKLTTSLEFTLSALPKITRPSTEDPETIEAATSLVETESIFDYLAQATGTPAPTLVLTSQDAGVPADAVVSTGLGFNLGLPKKGLLGVFDAVLGTSEAIQFSATLNLPGEAKVEPLGLGEHAWDRPGESGIHLVANLGARQVLAKVDGIDRIAFSSPKFHIYSPLNDESLLAGKAHEPEMGISGTLEVLDGPTLQVAGARIPGLSGIALTARLSGAPLTKGLAALTNLAGVELNAGSLIPSELGDTLASVGLKSASVSIEREGAGFKVTSAAALIKVDKTFTAGDGAGPPTLNLDDLLLSIENPFDAAERSLSATLSGSAEIGGAKFDAFMTLNPAVGSATRPGFNLSIAQAEGTSLPLTSALTGAFGTFPIRPPEIVLQDAAFSLNKRPGNEKITKEFSATLASGSTFDLGGGASVPHVNISVSDGGWRFAGDSSDGVSPIKLLGSGSKLASHLLGSGQIEFPAALNDAFTIHTFSIEHQRSSAGERKFVIHCSGTISPEPGISLATTVEATTTKADGKDPVTTFSGSVNANGVVFSLDFKSSGKSSAATSILTGTFDASSADAATLKLSEVLGLAGLDEDSVQRVPDVSVQLTSAFIAFRTSKKGLATEKHVLFGVKVGPRIDLSKTDENKIDLKKFGAAFDANNDLAIQFLVASNKLSGDALAEIKAALSEATAGLPDKAIPKGVTATLRVGPSVIAQEQASTTPSADADGIPAPDGPAAKPDNSPKWFNVQKHIGPLHLKRVGVEFKDKDIRLVLDAAVAAAGLTLGLDGLSVETPIDKFDPSFGLTGLSLTVDKPPIEISGAFLRRDDDFLGTALIRTKQITLSAVGAYSLADPPSFFVFAALDHPIGGPNFFFVTGLAGGFGYNRDIRLPRIDQVENFLFLRMLAGTEPGLLPAANSSNPAGDVLRKLTEEDLVPPQAGTSWFALGIKFKSFEIIDCSALLFVKFGRELEIALLGLATLKLPRQLPGQPVKRTYLQAQLAFNVSIKPLEGVFAAQARLTAASYVINENCRLSGGFAFFVWFAPHPQAGDFVLTLGGYHPRFKPPAHYPQVEPLAVNWTVNSNISVKGSAYFALTPSCVMAGGRLEATYNDGTISAYFIAGANFLIRWDPFAYDIEVFLRVGASVNWETIFGTLTLSFSLSASLELWGPEFAGIAHVDLSVVSFDVAFGSTPRPVPKILTWSEFSKTFLPEPKLNQGWTGPDQSIPLCQITATGGLERETANRQWIMGIHGIEFSTNSAMPSTSINKSPSKIAEDPNPLPIEAVGIRSMGGAGLVSKHTVQVIKETEPGRPLDLTDWRKLVRRASVPKEIWDVEYKSTPPNPSAELLSKRIVGFEFLRPPDPATSTRLPVMSLVAFTSERLDEKGKEPRLPLDQALPLDAPELTAKDPLQQIADTLSREAIVKTRSDTIDAARQFGFKTLGQRTVSIDGEKPEEAAKLFQTSNGVRKWFLSEPMIGAVGSVGAPPKQDRPKVSPVQPPQEPSIPSETIAELVAEVFPQSGASVDDAAKIQTSSASPGAGAPAAGAVSLLGEDSLIAQLPPVVVGNKSILVAPTRLAGAAPVPTKSIHPGTTLVWSLSHRDSARPRRSAVRIDPGKGAIRIVVTSNLRQSILDRVELADPLTFRTIDLPLSAARIVITAVKVPPKPQAAAAVPAPSTEATAVVTGWNTSSRFLELGPTAFVSGQVTVTTQGQFELGIRGGQTGPGFLSGEELVRQNRVPLSGNRTTEFRSGGFETSLPSGCKTLAVVLQRGNVPAAVGAGTTVEATDTAGRRIQLLPEFSFIEPAGTIVLLYSIPSGLRVSDAGRIDFFTEASGGAQNWAIHAVLGIREQVFRVRLNWAQFQLARPVPEPVVVTEEPVPVAVAVVGA